MNSIAQSIATHQSQQPQNQQYDSDRPQHVILLSDCSFQHLSLLPQNLLDLADLFLNFAGCLFVFPFGFQLGIHADFSDDLLQLTLCFVKLAFRLILRARFNGIPPLGFRFDCRYFGRS